MSELNNNLKAYKMLKLLNDGGEKIQWVKPPSQKFARALFTPSKPDMYLNDVYMVTDKKDNIYSIGKYEDRYYFDEDLYESDYGYFFSIGKSEKTSTPPSSIATYFDINFQPYYTKGEFQYKLDRVYNNIVMNDIKFDEDEFLNNF